MLLLLLLLLLEPRLNISLVVVLSMSGALLCSTIQKLLKLLVAYSANAVKTFFFQFFCKTKKNVQIIISLFFQNIDY